MKLIDNIEESIKKFKHCVNSNRFDLYSISYLNFFGVLSVRYTMCKEKL